VFHCSSELRTWCTRLLPLLLLLQVADRVLLQSGGQSWWGAIIGRAKLQRGVQQRSATTLVSMVG
jgi:hypothetical protein